ncbi:MAG: TolC family protein [Xanthomonadales bacterium]|nr:TolC family protein [Gammaproteobacteria bacterium]MBT8052339.1 TolC family protein [Gammaproteobacteria bacterium]NND56551.1 TolC family protein [Xanthomonadales bacterium]NNK52550.1 TolC family protein [Xanthomonadales bacterium]
MSWTQSDISYIRAPRVLGVLAGILLSANIQAAGLSLESAEELALASDPGVQSVQANQRALDEMSVAAGQLPDPMLKMGVVGLPTDTFNLGQEAMTQVQLGLVQKFPRGKSRSLRSAQIGLKSEGLDEIIRDQELQILLAVREQFLEVLKQRELARINAAATLALTDVAEITKDYYATGRVYQHDVLQAAVELAKVEDRATRIAQDEERARTRLATWIGDAAYRELDTAWPDFGLDVSGDAIKPRLTDHPRIRSLEKSISAAETGVELAKQRYKPEFAVDVTYGGRGGTNPDGRSRADLLSLMVVMDIPLFRKNRQDRVVAAQVAESSAALFTRDDVLRRMRSEVDFHYATYQRQRDRIELFENTLLPDASFSSEASLAAYQSSVENLTTLLRTQITEYELQLEHARLRAEVLKTQARLRYLEGV